ncbi:DUF2961 domain-containing protein [Rufibacter hautae]|uniref:DUF2961 domain-containing protein n=1 Tax=Rufibacter hautae TaxID=2595005 RepID=A0A5B6TBJ4_9BACT|nr:DUF2961 domain-containing protein [Rufibacter hautae]KAA3437859.1 DUF2961 domain-containing protein [Rufibacter hautae]
MKTSVWIRFILATFLLQWLALSAFSQGALSYVDLVNRLHDLEYLATPPHKDEKSGSFSSYDRRSRYDAVTNTYEAWGANGDGSGYIRKEGKDIVVFEQEGPGVIWRFWSALAKEGHIKIYIDNQPVPVVDKPFRDLFETVGNEVPPMNYPNLVMTLSRGRNHYLPISYSKHCKIVLSENWGAYYHITYTSLPKSTTIPSFTGTYTKQENFALAQTDRTLGSRGYERKHYDKEVVETRQVKATPNAEVLLREVQGNKAISYFKVNFDNFLTKQEKQSLIKNLWLSITWDNDKTPSVLTPLGVFFGTAPEVYSYRSLPVGVINTSFYSNWWMPFSKSAKIKLINKGSVPYDIGFTLVTVPLSESADSLMRFHAIWHQGLNRQEQISTIKPQDVLLADFEKGNYSGWEVSGNAFGKNPVKGTLPNQSPVSDFKGSYLVNSYLNGDSSIGTLTSRKFSINKRYINFLIGGGSHLNKTGLQLLVDGKVVRTATGMESEQLFPVSWDVAEFKGKQAVLKIMDLETGGYGHILVDQITLSDQNIARTDGRALDWTFLDVKGKGRFCGLTLHVENTWEEPRQESETWWYGKWDKKTIDWWWGEGDEKFFVDGEKFPSTYGTGSEDYIGYAWSAEPPFPVFDSPFASQPFTALTGNGHTIVNRFHIADNVPFQNSFEGNLEKYKLNNWGKNNRCLFDAVVYWYQMP